MCTSRRRTFALLNRAATRCDYFRELLTLPLTLYNFVTIILIEKYFVYQWLKMKFSRTVFLEHFVLMLLVGIPRIS